MTTVKSFLANPSTRLFNSLLLIAAFVFCSINVIGQNLSGTYRIKVKATNTFLHENGSDDKLVSTRYQVDDDYTVFILEKQYDNSYRIRVKANNRYLHYDGWGDKLISTRAQETDVFTHFNFVRQADGSYRIQSMADGKYLHCDGWGDKLISTRYQVTDDFTRFYLVSHQSHNTVATNNTTPKYNPPPKPAPQPAPQPAPKPEKAPEVYFTIPSTNQKMTTNELRKKLSAGGFTLVQTDKLQPNQCAMVFTNADADDISADFGMLMCVTQLGENVTLSSAAIYGGCDASSLNQGIGAKCEVGVGSADLKVLIPGGGETNFNLKGPAANACGSISAERMCGSVGATLASTSFEITDDNGTGVGFSLEAGVGAGLNGGYEDGILSASLNLRFLAGGSISFSINVEDVGEKIMKAGETGYVLVEKGMVAASEELARVFVRDIAPHVLVATNTIVASFEQTGKDMVEFFEGDFMDVMTDVDQYFQQAGKEIMYVFEGRKLSRPLKRGEGYLSVFNQAGYVSRVYVNYYHNGQLREFTKDISAGMTAEFFIPPGSQVITLIANGIGTFDPEALVKFYPDSKNLVKAYKCWGTIFDEAYAEVSAR